MNKVLTIHRFFIKLKNFSVTKKTKCTYGSYDCPEGAFFLFYQRISASSKISFSVFSQPRQGSVIDLP